MAGLDQTGGGMALTGFTLNEIIKQHQQGSWQRRNKSTATWLSVYPLFCVGGRFKANEWFSLSFSISLVVEFR